MSDTTRPARMLARTYAQRLNEVKERFVGRDRVIDLLGIAALCNEHVLVIGPPGTAKTRLLNDFCGMLETKPFTYLLTRFTEPAEIFGPINVKRFQQDGVYEINTEGMLPTARVAFLDEVFQGSSAILNTLLTLINERTFHDGRTSGTTPLITLVGSSNEIPDDPVLAAFSDRFLLRCNLDYVDDEQVEEVLALGWKAERQRIQADGAAADPHGNRLYAPISAPDLRSLQRAVGEIDLTAVLDRYMEIMRVLRGEGIAFSDRRAVKAQKIFAASALLAGRSRAELSDLAYLIHLWTAPEDEESLRRIVSDHGVPVDEPGGRVREVYEIVQVDLDEIVTRRGQVGTEHELRELIRRIQRLVTELRRDHPGEEAALERVKREHRTTLTLLGERFGREGLG
ncbi:AAA family ATPase [Streptosporangium sp. H16]|uniref:AAA family ATPase n=1 Tax=Streptosporangium sp. H16 TaxID=3444184 RepID=UPI003F7A7D8B